MTHSSWLKPALTGLSSALLLASLTGCSSRQVVHEPLVLRDDPAIQAIRSAVEEVQQQHALFVQVTTAHRERPVVSRPQGIPAFDRPVTVRNWYGPVGPALENIASDMGFGFDAQGTRPAIEPMVALDVVEKNAFDVLNLIVNQANNRYRVRVDVPESMLVLIYE